MIKNIQAINAGDIPGYLRDSCLDIVGDFPLHCSTGLIFLTDDGNPFIEWLKKQGYQFPDGESTGWLGVWGT